jgi:hypothetical protein
MQISLLSEPSRVLSLRQALACYASIGVAASVSALMFAGGSP